LVKDEFMRLILSESVLLILKFIGICMRFKASAPESYKFLEEKSEKLAMLRMVAETIYSEEIMKGLW
jgi:hypothetical protein